MLRRKKQSCGNNKAAWSRTPYKALERRHGRRHSKGQIPLHFLNLKWNFPCICVFLNDLCFCNDPSLKNLSAQGDEKLCHCSLLYSRKSVEVTTAKQGMVGMVGRGTVGTSRCDNTSITHCQILVSIPTPPMCWVHRAFSPIRLRRGDVTTLSYITALCNKQFFSPARRWTCIAKRGNGFGTVTWDISTSTALTTGTLLTAEPTASFRKCSLMLSSSFFKCFCLPRRRTHHRNVGRTSRSSTSTCSGLHWVNSSKRTPQTGNIS